MDIFNIQSLIKEGKLVSGSDIDPSQSYLQVGVYQPGNRKSGSSNADTYPSFAIPLSQIGGGPGSVTWGSILGTLSSQTDLVAALASKYDASNPSGYISGITSGDVTSALGYTPYDSTNPAGYITSASASSLYVPLSRQLTINGVTQDLSANRSWTISVSSSISTSGSSLYSTSPAAGPGFSTNNSNFFGSQAGNNATNANNSNFLGENAGRLASNASNSNFIGASAGRSASGASNSNFIGNQSGDNASNAFFSNFIGSYSGYIATNAQQSNFIGYEAGYNATNANYSQFLGQQAGYTATNASNSVFIGNGAGRGATGASNCSFIGTSAGFNASSASQSNFIGALAGWQATNAANSVFIGNYAGQSASNASFSTFVGYSAGQNSSANNVIALGFNAGIGNTISGQFIVSVNNLPQYADLTAATTALSGGVSGNRYLWIDASDNNTVKAFIP